MNTLVNDIKIIFDTPYEPPSYILIAPWAYKVWKKHRKMFGRRDKRRKHKRYS